jgi:hypothetical protein
MRNSSSIATSRSVRPTTPVSRTPRSASSPSSLAGFLDGPQPLDDARAGDELPGLRKQLQELAVPGDAESRVVETEPPAGAGQRSRCRVQQLACDDLPREVIGDLLARLGGVAEIGEEAVLDGPRAVSPFGREQREPVSTREPRQVAQVDRRIDQERVEAALLQLLRHLRGAAQQRQRGRGRHAQRRSSSSRTRTSASR